MADFKPRPGTFLPFMEASQRAKVSGQSAPVSPLTLLEILARQAQQSLPMFDLQTLSGLEPSRYAEALEECRVYSDRGRGAGASHTADQQWLRSDTARPACLTQMEFKNIKLREWLSAQFRTEISNPLNRVVFGTPVTDLSAKNFGSIVSQANSARQIQFGLKLIW